MKYSKVQLKQMAIRLLAEQNAGSVKFLQFIMNMTMRTGKSPGFITDKIKEYVGYDNI